MKKRFVFTRNLILNIIVSFLLFIFMLGSTFFVLAIKSTFNGGVSVLISIFWIPMAIFIVSFTLFYRKEFYSFNFSTLGYWLYALVSYPGLLLLSYGYGLAINAFTGSGEIIIFEGKVIEKEVLIHRGKTYFIKIVDKKTKTEEAFTVDFDRYNSLSVGDVYKEKFYKGGFGIPYRW
jgi:hypothetical protein